MYDDVQDWDPASAFSLEVLPLSNIYEPLLWLDASGNEPRFIPALATSYERSEDALRWTFHLRHNVMFHDGEPYNASAVKTAIERTKSLGIGPSFIWEPVDSIEVIDPYQITFHLSYPAPMDRIVSSQYGAWVYSPRLASMDPDSIKLGYAAGTGPYKLQSWNRNQGIRLSKNENYWGGFDGKHFETIDIRIVSEASTRIQMIKGGAADICSLIPIEALESLQNHPEIELKAFPSWINHFYIFNVRKPPTDDIRIRRALAKVLDYQQIVKYVYGGLAEIPSGFVPRTLPGALPPDSLYSFDLDEARRLVESVPQESIKKIELSYVATSDEYRKTAYMLQANAEKIGLEIKLNAGLWSEIWSKARNFELSPNIIGMAWWPTYATPSDWFVGMFQSQEVPLFNLSYYSNPALDSLVSEARKMEATGVEKAANLYKEIQTILVRDCVAIPVVDLNMWILVRKEITGFRANPAYATILFYPLRRQP